MTVALLVAKIFGCYILTFALLLVIGDAILFALGIKPGTKKFYTEYFFKLLTGVLFVVTCYSIACTHLRTINLGFLILLVMAFIYQKKEKAGWFEERTRWDMKDWKNAALFTLLTGMLFFFWQASGFIKGGLFNYSLNLYDTVGQEDYIVYSNISNYLKITGEENIFRSDNLVDPSFNGTTPYHYFEIWLNAIISSVFSMSSFVSLQLICYPVFYCLVLAGILALIEIYRHPSFAVILFSVLLMFASGIYLSFYATIPFLEQIHAFAIVPMTVAPKKLMVQYVFIIAGILLTHSRHKNASFFFWLCLPLVSTDSTFAVFGGIFLYLLSNFFTRSFTRQQWTLICTSLVLIVLFVFTFYRVAGNRGVMSGTAFSLRDLLNPADLATRIHIIAATPIQYLVVFAPFLILACLGIGKIKVDKQTVHLFLFVFMVLVGGLIGWVYYFKVENSYQFFKNLAIVTGNILLIYAIIRLSFDPAIFSQVSPVLKKVMVGGASAIIFYSFFTFHHSKFNRINRPIPGTYSDEYLTTISAYVSEHPIGNSGAYIRESYTRNSKFDLMTVWLPLGEYLVLTDQPVLATDLSVFSIDLDQGSSLATERLKSRVMRTPFYRFVEQEKSNGNFINIEQSQADFIQKNKMKFVVIARGAKLPGKLASRIEQTFEDSLSGEKFIALRNE